MIVPTIEKALVKRIPNILLHVDPIICVSFPVIIAIPYMIVVIIPTLIITNKATLTIVPISSVCDFFCIISKSFRAASFATRASFLESSASCNAILSSSFILVFSSSET